MAVLRARVVTIGAVMGVLVCFAPSQVGIQDKQAGDAAFSQMDHEKAAESYRKVVLDDPNNGKVWYRLGTSLHSMRKFSEAIPCFKRAVDLKYSVHFSHYNLACSYAMAGQTEEALVSLDKAVKSGYTMTDSITTDVDLESIRNTARFAELMRWADKPVQQFSEGRKLEGMRGAWDVATSDGRAGTLTANVGSKGYAIRLDLFVDGLRVAYFLVYFVAHENEWRVAGADAGGAVYEGAALVQDGSLVCVGKQMAEGKKEEVRMRVSVEGSQNGQITKEALVDGAWSPVQAYRLNGTEGGAGGR